MRFALKSQLCEYEYSHVNYCCCVIDRYYNVIVNTTSKLIASKYIQNLMQHRCSSL